MPEGDTIFRAARTLERVLAGQPVTRFETVLPRLARVDEDAPIAGRTVEAVRAEGKWLLMEFSGGLILLTHMLMSGSWHIYRPGERWQRGLYHMRIVVETPHMLAVAFNIPVAEFHTPRSLARRRGFNSLGPSLLAEDFDAERAIANLASSAEPDVATALLRQSIMAGVGNVFKSEVCFASGVHPFRRPASLSGAELAEIVAAARELLLANVAEGSREEIVTWDGMRRTTRRADPSQRLWVYGRAGERCRRCGERIRAEKRGEDARITFWCPGCQKEDGQAKSRA